MSELDLSDPEIIVNDSDSEEDKNIPSMAKCQEMITSFVDLTNTDVILAQYLLQDTWNLEAALNKYYESEPRKASTSGVKPTDDNDVIVTFDSGEVVTATTKPADMFKFLSWNIDAIDDNSLKIRMKAVVKLINNGSYDIVHLQEVTPTVQKYLEENLPQYMFIAGGCQDYYIATLLKITTIHFDSKIIHEYPNSVMGRNLLEVEAHIGEMCIRLLNTHLESTAEFSTQRVTQLRNAFAQMVRGQDNNKHAISLLAGDLNIRDKEIKEVGVPYGMTDVWMECGLKKECQYTWDLTRNTNKSFAGKFKPRCRFDRAYLFQVDCAVDPIYFGLEGIQKVEGTQKFPSDHWGIQIHFKINDNSTQSKHQENMTQYVWKNSRPQSEMAAENGVEDADVNGDVVVLD